MAGGSSGPVYSESKYIEYEDSIQDLTSLSTKMFGHLFSGKESLTLERFMNETGNGYGNPIMVGTSKLCLFWFACEHCEPLTAN